MSDLQTRPVALDMLPENIPAELKALPVWTCWSYEQKIAKLQTVTDEAQFKREVAAQ